MKIEILLVLFTNLILTLKYSVVTYNTDWNDNVKWNILHFFLLFFSTYRTHFLINSCKTTNKKNCGIETKMTKYASGDYIFKHCHSNEIQYNKKMNSNNNALCNIYIRFLYSEGNTIVGKLRHYDMRVFIASLIVLKLWKYIFFGKWIFWQKASKKTVLKTFYEYTCCIWKKIVTWENINILLKMLYACIF